ncbi:MAG TPA: acyltransferase family protein [Burkholderiaceae bacterium]|nr:acyltransferase family protein [Burkholderiaceae bacterium]
MLEQEKPTFRYDINALRAIAVIAVIAYHFDIVGFSGGFVGVDVFFVISGFLITSQIQQSLIAGRFSYANFYASRLRRIFPALVAMCMAILLFGWFYILPKEYLTHAKTAWQALYFGSNYAFGVSETGPRGYFDAVATSVSPFLHTWSLSVEGQFYLIFPIAWVLIFKQFARQQSNIVFALLGLALIYFAFDTAHHTEQSFYSLPVRAWEFLAGACLVVLPASLQKCLKGKWLANINSVLGLLLIIASVYFLDNKLLWPSAWTLLPVVGAVMVILGNETLYTQYLFKNLLLQRTGDMSYSLYLWHWPLIVFAKHYVAIYQRNLRTIEIVTLLIITLMAAFLSWRFIELPIRKNKIFWTNKFLSTMAVIMILIFWVGWRWLSIAQGVPERFDAYSKKITSNKVGKFVFPYTKMCNLVTGESSELNKCVLQGANKADNKRLPDFVVWGDSHAHHYLPAILQAAETLDLNGLMVAKAACRPTLSNQTAYHSSKAEQLSCTIFNNNANALISALPSVRTVILGRMWFHGVTVNQTIDLTKALVAAGKKVILIGALPDPDLNVPQIWFERNIWERKFIDEMTQVRNENGMDRIDQYVKTELLQEIALGRVVFLDAMVHFCDQSNCYLVKNGKKNFVDHSHITEAKALEFTDAFKEALR